MQHGGESADLGVFLSRGSSDFMGMEPRSRGWQGTLGAVLAPSLAPSLALQHLVRHRQSTEPLGSQGSPSVLPQPQGPWQAVGASLHGDCPASVGTLGPQPETGDWSTMEGRILVS